MNIEKFKLAKTLMKQKKWKEAQIFFDEIISGPSPLRGAYLQASIACFQQKDFKQALNYIIKQELVFPLDNHSALQKSKCLIKLNHIEEAVGILVAFDLPNLKLLSDNLAQVKNTELVTAGLKKLSEEDFNFINATCFAMFMYKTFRQDRTAFQKYLKIIEKFGTFDCFSMASIGLPVEYDDDFIRKVMLTNDKSIILKIFSLKPLHHKNIEKLKKSNLYTLIPSNILRNAYINYFTPPKYLLSQSVGSPKKLKIALCVSGQLRGYKEAFKSWEKFHFGSHDLDTYVCVWKDIGRKELHKGHLSRLFPVNFSQEIRNILAGKDIKHLQNILPSVFKYFDKKVEVDDVELEKLYNTKNIKIVEDEGFKGKTNTFKMYYMINQCWNMVDNPEQYDLIIRIRPDKSLVNFSLDLNEFHKINSALIPDKAPSIHLANIYMGDQFSIARPEVMKIYSETYTNFINNEGIFKLTGYEKLIPHTSLYGTMIENDIDVIDHDGLIEFGELLDPSKIHINLLREMVLTDLASNKELRQKFEKALDLDELI